MITVAAEVVIVGVVVVLVIVAERMAKLVTPADIAATAVVMAIIEAADKLD